MTHIGLAHLILPNNNNGYDKVNDDALVEDVDWRQVVVVVVVVVGRVRGGRQ